MMNLEIRQIDMNKNLILRLGKKNPYIEPFDYLTIIFYVTFVYFFLFQQLLCTNS